MAVSRVIRCKALSALAICSLLSAPEASAQLTLEIPEEEFEGAEDYKPIPPVSMDVDLTGTLPEAVLEEMLGESPYDFVDVVWGMEVTGNWTESVTGTGTLQVTDFTEGLGASTRLDPERYTGQHGFSMYNARLQAEGDDVFRLFMALPPESGGVAFGNELDGGKAFFEVMLCHMFERDRRGCIDYPDEYYETELPELSKLHIMRRGRNAYKIEFAARVRETRTYPHPNRGYSLTDPTGRFADVRGWVCDRVTWEGDPESCAPPEPLLVASSSPPHRRENVHLKTPEIEVEFNVPVDADDLEEHFSLSTRDDNGKPLDVAGRISSLSDTHFQFELDGPLESGVIYEARIEGGEEGVEGRNGELLASDSHWWRFTTLVDLENHGKPVEEPVRTHVYQTVRDAPLVVDKPALQRIYVEWQPHDHIHKGWQPESYPAELEISVIDQSQWRIDPQSGGSVEGNVVRVVRSDIPENKDARREVERQARNTINVYGWTPDQQGGISVIETQLTAHDPYPQSAAAQDVVAEREAQHWHMDPAPLVFRYTFLQVGSWSDGVPEAEMQAAETMIRMAEEFAVQLMPVREAYGIDTGREADQKFANIYRDYFTAAIDVALQIPEFVDVAGLNEFVGERIEGMQSLEDEGHISRTLSLLPTGVPDTIINAVVSFYLENWEENFDRYEVLTDLARKEVNLEALKNTIRAVREEIGSFFSGNDILVVFYPPDFFSAGRSFGQATHHAHGRHGVAMPIPLDRTPSELAEGLVHEFGHYFDLWHRPLESSEIDYEPWQFPVSDIEGFRLAIDGMSGHNKSSKEGNSEHPATLAPLMWPRLLDRTEVWVSKDEYLTLMRSFATRLP